MFFLVGWSRLKLSHLGTEMFCGLWNSVYEQTGLYNTLTTSEMMRATWFHWCAFYLELVGEEDAEM